MKTKTKKQKSIIIDNDEEMQDSNEFFPWEDVDAGMDNVITPLSGHERCPDCGKPSEDLKWINFSSPIWTWQNLMGCGRPMSICTDCHRQVEFICDIMN